MYLTLEECNTEKKEKKTVYTKKPSNKNMFFNHGYRLYLYTIIDRKKTDTVNSE